MPAGRPRTVDPGSRSPQLERYYENPELYRAQIEEKRQARKTDFPAFMRDRLTQVKARAKAVGVEFTLDQEWLALQSNTCALTGVPFVITPKGKGPLTPSFDRIDPTKGYTKANTRIVACWINMAKGNWPDGQIQQLICAAADHIRSSKVIPVVP